MINNRRGILAVTCAILLLAAGALNAEVTQDDLDRIHTERAAAEKTRAEVGRSVTGGDVVVDLRSAKPGKKLTPIGTNCQSWGYGSDYSYWLGEGREVFKRALRDSGVKVLRFPIHTLKDFDYYNQNPTGRAFRPEQFYDLCRELDIKVIAMANIYKRPDESGKMVDIPMFDDPKAAAKNAARWVKWVKDHGYSDIVMAWEIGNEIWFDYTRDTPIWEFEKAKAKLDEWKGPYDPEGCRRWAALHASCAKAMKQADPSIKVAVSSLTGSWWLPDKLQGKKLSACLGALGKGAKYIDYLDVHQYGWTPAAMSRVWHEELIKPNPNCRHLRYINTEWGPGVDMHTMGNCFAYSGLLLAKCTADLTAVPKLDWISGFHELHDWGGPIILCKDTWSSLWPKYTAGPESEGRGPRYIIGAYGPVLRFFNDAIARCPSLLASGCTVPDSTNQFFNGATSLSPLAEKPVNPAMDPAGIKPSVQWWVTTNPHLTSVSVVLINTHETTKSLRIMLPVSWQRAIVMRGESFTSTNLWESLKLQGGKQPWGVQSVSVVTDGQPTHKRLAIDLPAFSVVRVELLGEQAHPGALQPPEPIGYSGAK